MAHADGSLTIVVMLTLLQINGQIKQSGNTSSMIFPIPRLIEHISSIMTLEVRALTLTTLSRDVPKHS